MSDPFRLRVLKRLTAILQEITIEDLNSAPTIYNYDLRTSVFRGRNFFGDGDPIPMVSILETPIAEDQLQAPPERSGSTTNVWGLMIQGFVKDDKQNPTDPAYLLAADVICRLALEKVRPGIEKAQNGKVLTPLLGESGVLDMRIGSPVCRPADEVSAQAYFWLRIDLQLAENLTTPYA